jgi:hypothetical protein
MLEAMGISFESLSGTTTTGLPAGTTTADALRTVSVFSNDFDKGSYKCELPVPDSYPRVPVDG